MRPAAPAACARHQRGGPTHWQTNSHPIRGRRTASTQTWDTQATAALASRLPRAPTGGVTPGSGAMARANAWSAISGLTSPFGPSIAMTESNAVWATVGDVGCGEGDPASAVDVGCGQG